MNGHAARTSSARILGCALMLGAGQVGCATSKAPKAAVAKRPEQPQAVPAPAPQEASKLVDQRMTKLQLRWASLQCGVAQVDVNRVPAIASLSSSAEGRVLVLGGKLLNVETGVVAEAPVDASYGFWAVPGTDYFATSTSWRTPPLAVWNGRGEVLYRCGAGGAPGSDMGGSPPLPQAELDAICKAGVEGVSLPEHPLSVELKAQAKGYSGAGIARRAEAVVLSRRDSEGTWLTVWQKGRGLVRLNKTPLASWGWSAISDDAKTVAYAHDRNLYLYHLGAKPSEEGILLDRKVKSLLFTRGSQDVTVLQAGRVGKVVDGQVQPLFVFAEVPFQKPSRVDAGTWFVDLVQPTRIQLNIDAMLSSPVSTQPVSRGNVSPDGALVARPSGQSVSVESTAAARQQRKLLEVAVSNEARSSYGSPSVERSRVESRQQAPLGGESLQRSGARHRWQGR
ncbi:MAG: hypothetical protein QM784_17395 [Polyangiaceae bacterium]